jgi:hypothetical protein
MPNFEYGQFYALNEPLKAFGRLVVRHETGERITRILGKYHRGGIEDTQRIAQLLHGGVEVSPELAWLIEFSAPNIVISRSETQRRRDEKKARELVGQISREELAIYEFMLCREREHTKTTEPNVRVFHTPKLTEKIKKTQQLYYANDNDAYKRLAVILGLKRAGNNSIELVKEANDILNMFEKRKVISAKHSHILMRELRAI